MFCYVTDQTSQTQGWPVVAPDFYHILTLQLFVVQLRYFEE